MPDQTLSRATLAALRPAVIPLAHRAGRAILEVYAKDFVVAAKADRSPLTAADLAAHRILLAGLRELTPQLPVLSEEAADIPWAERQSWPRLWLVDPLDGTREFVRRNGEFCVCLALIEHGQPLLGVVHAPIRRTTWSAVRGLGAWCQQDDAAEQALPAHRPVTPLADGTAMRVAVSRSHRDARIHTLLAHLPRAECLAMGSAIKFGLLAQGELDLYPRFGPTSEWDTAAGQCLVEAVGGAVLDLHGQPLRYNCRPTLLNPDFIALADPALPWRNWLD